MDLRSSAVRDSQALPRGAHPLATGLDGTPSLSPEDPGAAEGCVASNALLRGRSSVAILHNGSVYRLQATKLGKLILTK